MAENHIENSQNTEFENEKESSGKETDVKVEGTGSGKKKELTKGKTVLFSLISYFVLWIISFLLLILLIRSPLFSGMEVLMYRGIIMIILSGLIAAGLSYAFKRLKKVSWLDIKDYITVFIICCCINLAFFILIPVTVERSVSVFMLSYMDNYDRGYTEEEIAEIFFDKYVNEYGAFEKRFNEQLETGSIVENPDGSYSLTDTGKFIVKMFRLTADVYKTDQRLVNP